MGTLTLNQILAANLNRLIEAAQISEKALGQKAGISPRTVSNYRKTDSLPTSRGKERSAKLAEVQALAIALGVHPLALLTDPAESAARAQEVAAAVQAALAAPSKLPGKPWRRAA